MKRGFSWRHFYEWTMNLCTNAINALIQVVTTLPEIRAINLGKDYGENSVSLIIGERRQAHAKDLLGSHANVAVGKKHIVTGIEKTRQKATRKITSSFYVRIATD